MNIKEVENDPELRQVLWACYDHWKNDANPPDKRRIWSGYIMDSYRNRFGSEFHQTKLYWVTKHGSLTQAESVRGGARRYYKMIDPDKILNLLQKCGLA